MDPQRDPLDVMDRRVVDRDGAAAVLDARAVVDDDARAPRGLDRSVGVGDRDRRVGDGQARAGEIDPVRGHPVLSVETETPVTVTVPDPDTSSAPATLESFVSNVSPLMPSAVPDSDSAGAFRPVASIVVAAAPLVPTKLRPFSEVLIASL